MTLTAHCARMRDPARRVAEQFFTRYVIEIDLHKALALTTGQARDKLAKEIASLQGMKAPPSAKPRIGYTFVREETKGNAKVIYYDIDIKRERYSAFQRKVEILVSKVKDQWMVSNFAFID
jgi:hypothetical protein